MPGFMSSIRIELIRIANVPAWRLWITDWDLYVEWEALTGDVIHHGAAVSGTCMLVLPHLISQHSITLTLHTSRLYVIAPHMTSCIHWVWLWEVDCGFKPCFQHKKAFLMIIGAGTMRAPGSLYAQGDFKLLLLCSCARNAWDIFNDSLCRCKFGMWERNICNASLCGLEICLEKSFVINMISPVIVRISKESSWNFV